MPSKGKEEEAPVFLINGEEYADFASAQEAIREVWAAHKNALKAEAMDLADLEKTAEGEEAKGEDK